MKIRLPRSAPKRFGVIYADPPWQFVTRAAKGENHAVPARGEQPYETMSLDDLMSLEVAAVAADDCVLIMWIIDSHLEQALALGKAWGFTYKTRGLTWRKLVKDGSKTKIGMGYWFRGESERCLLFTRGSPKRVDAGVREIIDAPVREHSRKPDEAYERIERLAAGPYLELFSRSAPRPGWTEWGDQTGLFGQDPSADGRKPRRPLEDIF